jgi:hypothetical protein
MKSTALISLSLSIAACSSSMSTSPPSQPATSADYEDTAQTIGSSMATSAGGTVNAGDALAIRDAVHIALGRLPIGFAVERDGRVRGDRMGINNAFMITCKDKTGATLAKCDSTTDSATVVIQWKGSVQTPNFSASIDREGNFTITGLQSDTATVNGDSSFSFDTTMMSVFRPGVTSSASFDFTATYAAITVTTAATGDKDRDDREITGGSATFEVKGTRMVTGTAMGSNDVNKSFDVHAVLTFNGDGTATLVLDGTQTFTIDLHSGKVTKKA